MIGTKKELFGTRSDGRQAWLYTISSGNITAVLSDHGATLVRLFVPDRNGNADDIVLGFDDLEGYVTCNDYYGATVGRNSNRVGGAKFLLNGKMYRMDANDNDINNLHSGFDSFKDRLWQVVEHTENSVCFYLESPDGDQGFPGNAKIQVRYCLENGDLKITYDAVCDQDTVFNMTNHAFFNLAGQQYPKRCMDQILTLPATFFTVADAQSIPTGELRSVEGSPMDFRIPKPFGKDIDEDYEALNLQGGYDHNFEAKGPVCATLHDPYSGRTMEVLTDCPGIQVYSGNYLAGIIGKGGVAYTKRGGICLETQFYPDSVNHPQWPQPFVKANQPYHSETIYRFK